MARFMELGPHPERQSKIRRNMTSATEGEPLLDVEVKITPIKTHHYVISGIVAGLIGLSATYGALQAGSVALDRLHPNSDDTLATAYPSQGSDDSDTSTDTE